MIFSELPSFFEALQADFDYLRRSPTKRRRTETYHRMFGATDLTRDWSRALCSCSQSSCCPSERVVDTPKKAANFAPVHTRSSLSLCDTPQKKTTEQDGNDCTILPVEKLTTTIVESTDPDWDDESTQSEPEEVEEKFAAHLNLDQFAPSEISVQVLEDTQKRARKRTLEVRGRHSDHEGEDEYECIEYVKRLSLPHGVAPNQLRCTLDQTGHLVVEAPLSDIVEVPQIDSHAARTIPVHLLESTSNELQENTSKHRTEEPSDNVILIE